jgi:hypothetical protein
MQNTIIKSTFDALAGAYGVSCIESKNPVMWSYRHDEKKYRINYYFTTGTLTIQFANGKIMTFRKIWSDADFEELLIKYNK